ncbi:hypothetical protein AB0K08_15545 [Citricoccus sp. NPDC055426]|uniref:hypothetical protein n=1 Tax=Citricoccus sp. NPDC055426 TaxID=3155536 RepID=UPI0034182E56
MEPSSKADTIRVLEEIGVPAASLRTIWRNLAACIDQDWRDAACRTAYAFAAAKAGPTGLSVVLYDVTTLYFEATDEDELRKVGMSNYAEVSVMPMSSSGRRESCWSAGFQAAVRAA